MQTKLNASVSEQIEGILSQYDALRYLPPWQIKALVPLALGQSVVTVAIAVGKKPEAIRKLFKDRLFKQALAIASTQVFNASSRLSAASSLEAIEVMRDIMLNKSSKPIDRIRAAAIILDRADYWDRWQISDRLEALEASQLQTQRQLSGSQVDTDPI